MELTSAPTQPSPAPEYVHIDLVLYLRALWRRKWLPIGLGLFGFVALYALSYTRPKIFESTVRFTPPAARSSAILFSLTRNSGDEFRSMLTTDAVAYDVVQHLDLVKVFKVKEPYQARGILGGMASFGIDANSFVVINTRSTDPVLAARVANEFYAALYRLQERIGADESAHRLAYVAGPIQIERKQLADAEDALREVQEKTGLVLPGTQAALGVQEVATLQNRISDLQTQLATARVSSTDENPRVITLRSQIGNLQGQVSALQSASQQANAPVRLPALSLEVQRRQREVQFHESAVLALTKGLETSQQIDSYTPTFALIDPAVPARAKSSPSRGSWAITGGFLGFLLGMTIIVVRAGYKTWLRKPSSGDAIKRWKASWNEPERKAHAA